MNRKRIVALARRVIRQVTRDHRTIGLLLFVPILVLTLGAVILRSDSPTIPLGVVDEDEGVTVPVAGKLLLSERIINELSAGEYFAVIPLEQDEIEERMQDGTVQGVIVFPEDFSAGFRQDQQVTIDLRLEGSNPARSAMITGRASEATIKALAGLAAMGLGAVAGDGETSLPFTLETEYLFAGEVFDAMDFIAPVYIAMLSMFFVFLLTCVSFLRERSQGTMERLLATPATRFEIVLG